MENIFENIIKDWNLSSFSKDKQKEMANRIGLILYQALLVRSLDILSDTEQTELDLLLNEDSTLPKDVVSFLGSKIPTLDLIIVEERNKLKSDLSLKMA